MTQKEVLLIQGHPDPSGKSLCYALGDAYAKGVKSAGAEIRRINVAALDFPLLRHAVDWRAGRDETPESLRIAADNVRWSDHMTIIYPLWLGTMPALLKGFIEQTFRPGVVLDDSGGGFPKPLLKGHTARIVITMGMPTLAYRWYFGAHSLKSLERSILKISGIKNISETLFGMVEQVKPATRQKWIQKMELLGARDAKK